MELDKTLGYHEIKVNFEFEKNRIGRMQTAPKINLKNATFLKNCEIDFDQIWQDARFYHKIKFEFEKNRIAKTLTSSKNMYN